MLQIWKTENTHWEEGFSWKHVTMFNRMVYECAPIQSDVTPVQRSLHLHLSGNIIDKLGK